MKQGTKVIRLSQGNINEEWYFMNFITYRAKTKAILMSKHGLLEEVALCNFKVSTVLIDKENSVAEKTAE